MNKGEKNHSDIERRAFLQGALAVAGIPPLCCVTPPLPSNSVEFRDSKIIINLARAPKLRKAGAAFNIVDNERKINLIVIHVNRNRYITMSRACTHGGAPCTYNPRRHTLQCTSLSHAEYSLEGTLLGTPPHGRIHGNLRTYPTKAYGSTIEVTLESNA